MIEATRNQKIWRWALIVGGLGLLGVGGLTLLLDVKPAAYLGILVWFAGALVIHDGIIGPIIFGVTVIMRKAGRRMPVMVLAIVQAAIVIAAILTALVLPAAIKKEAGSANPTILPLDYLPNLGGFYFVLAALTVAVVLIYLLVTSRREKRRSPIDQD